MTDFTPKKTFYNNNPTFDQVFYAKLSDRLNLVAIKSQRLLSVKNSNSNFVRASTAFNSLPQNVKTLIRKNSLNLRKANVKDLIREEIVKIDKDKLDKSDLIKKKPSTAFETLQKEEIYEPVSMQPNEENSLTTNDDDAPSSKLAFNRIDPIMSLIYDSSGNSFLAEEESFSYFPINNDCMNHSEAISSSNFLNIKSSITVAFSNLIYHSFMEEQDRSKPIKFCKNHGIVLPNFLLNTSEFGFPEYNMKPLSVPMPSPISFNCLGDKLEHFRLNEWIIPRVLACLPSSILQNLLKLPSIYEYKNDSNSVLSDYDTHNLNISSTRNINCRFSHRYNGKCVNIRELKENEVSKSNDTSIHSFFLKKIPSTWVSLGCLWATKPNESGKYNWSLRLFLLLDNLLLECNPEGTSILGYIQLSTAIIKNLTCNVKEYALGIYYKFPSHFPNISSIISISGYSTCDGHLNEYSDSYTLYIASSYLEQITGVFSSLKQAAAVSVFDLYHVEGIFDRKTQIKLADNENSNDDFRRDGLLGRGRYSEVRIGAHTGYQFPAINLPSIAQKENFSIDQNELFNFDSSKESYDVNLQLGEEIYDDNFKFNHGISYSECEEFRCDKNPLACALKIISKANFSELCKESKERNDALVREILSMMVLTAVAINKNINIQPNNNLNEEEKNFEVDFEYIRNHIPFAMLHSIFESPWGLVIAEDHLSSIEDIRGMEEEGEVLLDLFDLLSLKGPLDEEDCKDIVIQLLLTIIKFQQIGIAHRDIKLSNILVKPKSKSYLEDGCKYDFVLGNADDSYDSDDLQALDDQKEDFIDLNRLQIPYYNPKNKYLIKLTDFGMCGFTSDDGLLKGRCGTPGCVAPEILNTKIGGKYTPLVDTFSLGVVAFLLLLGYEPFPNNSIDQFILSSANEERDIYETKSDNLETDIYKSTSKLKVPSNWKNGWEDLNEECQSFLLFVLHPTKRFSAYQALHHPWLLPHYQSFKASDL